MSVPDRLINVRRSVTGTYIKPVDKSQTVRTLPLYQIRGFLTVSHPVPRDPEGK